MSDAWSGQWREANAPQIVTSAQLLHREVPIRLARRIVDLENLPDELPDAPSVLEMRRLLLHSFESLIQFPLPHNLESERKFVEMHRNLRVEHVNMHRSISAAIKDLDYEPEGLSESLDNFYNSRIGIRMLLDQHVAAQTPVPGFTGLVADKSSPVKIAENIIDTASPLWQQSLGGAKLPEFKITGDPEAGYRYIPQHIEIILTEVFKNAVINSLNAPEAKNGKTPPPVSVFVSGGAHGVCIKVSDVGGGMTRDEANARFSYYQSAATSSTGKANAYDPVSSVLESRAGGLDFADSFGLRIASLYASYFGGALSLMPMEGHGVDAYIYMNCLTGASEVK